jgi:pimeloyl-ACP methyl ester carboxylesterase
MAGLRSFRAGLAFALALPLLAAPAPAAAKEPPAISFAKCDLAAPFRPRRIEADCGRFTVPEDRAKPGGKTIELHVALLHARAKARHRAPDPVFLLAGGPGQAASESFTAMEGAFEWIRRKRDVVLVDQRGTGKSNALKCEGDPEQKDTVAPNEAKDAALLADCLAKLPGDPRFYTTSVALDDLDAVRQALGYKEINLWGGSYGTRVALGYLRKYPSSTRSVVVDGVAPMDLALGPDISIDSQRALEQMLERCAAEPACAKAFPDLRREFAQLVARVKGAAVPVTVRDPLSGEEIRTTLTYDGALGAVRMLLYASESVSLLPLLIHTSAGGDYAPLAALAAQVRHDLGGVIAMGMHMSVLCTEDVPFLTPDPAKEQALRETYLGVHLMDFFRRECARWPAGVLDDGFKKAVVSDKPVLLLSGEIDPVTPPANAERALETLSNAKHLVAANQGHIVTSRGCGPRLFAEFVDSADPKKIDGACLTRLHGAPFFVRFSGPEP